MKQTKTEEKGEVRVLVTPFSSLPKWTPEIQAVKGLLNLKQVLLIDSIFDRKLVIEVALSRGWI